MPDSGASDTSQARDGKLERYQEVLLVLLGLFGCLVTWGGMTQFVDDLWLRFAGLETIGVVIEHEAESSTIAPTPSRVSRSAAGGLGAEQTVSRALGSTIVFRPIVAIDTPDGHARIRGALLVGRDRVAPIGTKVPVLYPARRPADGRLKSDVKLSWVYLLTAVVGFGLAAGPLAILLLTGTWRLPDRWFVASRSGTR